MAVIVPDEIVEERILLVRGQKVMLDRNLAKLYGVETRVLNQAVKRNKDRFPEDFMFSLTREEIMNLSQFVIGSKIKHAPNVYAFTEQGVAMLSTQKKLAQKLNELEGKVERHDEEIKAVFDAMRQLMTPPEKNKRKIGFEADEQ